MLLPVPSWCDFLLWSWWKQRRATRTVAVTRRWPRLPQHDLPSIAPLGAWCNEKQQHAAHMFLKKDTFAKHTDTRASAKLTRSKWIKKGVWPGGDLLREEARGGKRRRDRDVYRQSKWHASLISNIIMCSFQQWGKPVSEIAWARISCPISSSPWDKWREQGCWEWSDARLPPRQIHWMNEAPFCLGSKIPSCISHHAAVIDWARLLQWHRCRPLVSPKDTHPRILSTTNVHIRPDDVRIITWIYSRLTWVSAFDRLLLPTSKVFLSFPLGFLSRN